MQVRRLSRGRGLLGLVHRAAFGAVPGSQHRPPARVLISSETAEKVDSAGGDLIDAIFRRPLTVSRRTIAVNDSSVCQATVSPWSMARKAARRRWPPWACARARRGRGG